jgi:hypothetical protein
VVPANTTLTVDGDLNLGSLLIEGTVLWTDDTQSTAEQWLCSGYVVVEGNGQFLMDVKDKNANIYLKDNGAAHPGNFGGLGSRVLGGVHTADSAPGFPRIDIEGRVMARTWSLLSSTATEGSTSLNLMHDVSEMGWRVGDRIAIASMAGLSNGNAQWFFLTGFSGGTVNLDGTLSQNYMGENPMRAEVINLSRNVLITGDDLDNVPCGNGRADGCACRGGVSQCTMGLHVMMAGSDGPNSSGVLRMQHTRVEKCGQRGVLARYCVHFHLMQKCPDCLLRGNAVENGHQRGIVIHGTHLTTVEENVMYDVRGANYYVEDGNELHNWLRYNIAICPWAFNGPYDGCTVPGTDNDQADTNLNQAGLWSLSNLNNVEGNRFANHYNGILFDTQFAPRGRGSSEGMVCTTNLPFGRVVGNTCHGHGRFGLYFLVDTYPKDVQVSMDDNGHTDFELCESFDDDGEDRGVPVEFFDNVDFDSTWMGSYGLGDIQYHKSHLERVSLYWKESKNVADECSAMVLDSYSKDVHYALPDVRGTMLIENTIFEGRIFFEANHHCGVGVTGMLCNPQYIFLNPTWNAGQLDFQFPGSGGGVFALAPPDAANPDGKIFPAGFQGFTNGDKDYLLGIDSGSTCVRASSVSSNPNYNYGNGIVCNKPLRRLNVWSKGGQGTAVRIEVIQNGAIVGGKDISWWSVAGKEGYPMAVVVDESVTYRLTGVQEDWVVEFSDTIMSNRFGVETLNLEVVGRTCAGNATTSSHDRRFITGGVGRDDRQFGRGACTAHPDMPRVSCGAPLDLPTSSSSSQSADFPLLPECPELCSSSCNNGFCDCGAAECRCHPGFSGPSCEIDMCAEAECSEFGTCAAKYLGGLVPVTEDFKCDCTPPYAGPTCESNPCPENACNGAGTCIGVTATSYRCECDLGVSGAQCEVSCNDICQGTWPYSCNASIEPSFCVAGGGCQYDEGGYTNPNACPLQNDSGSHDPIPSPGGPTNAPPAPTNPPPTNAPPAPTNPPPTNAPPAPTSPPPTNAPPAPSSPPPTSPPSPTAAPPSNCSGPACPCPDLSSGWNNACPTVPGMSYCPANGGCYTDGGCPGACPPWE